MKARRQDFLLGLTVVSMIALLIASILFLAPRGNVRVRNVEVHFRQESGVAPIKRGSPVTLSGALQVGKVTEVGRIYRTSGAGRPGELLIRVAMEVDEDLTLYEDVQISTDQPPVGGAGIIVINYVGTPGRHVYTGGPIEGLPPQSFAAVIGTLSRQVLGPGGLMEKVNYAFDARAEGSPLYRVNESLTHLSELTAELRLQLNPRERQTLLSKLHLMLDDIGATLAALREQMEAERGTALLAKVHVAIDRLSDALAAASQILKENQSPLGETAQHVASIARKIDEEMLARLLSELNRDDPNTLLGKLHVGMDNLNGALADVQAVSDTARRVVVLNRPALDKTIENVQTMSAQLKLAADEIRIAPWRLLYQPTQRESDELSIFEAARTFAEAAAYLDDASARLQSVVDSTRIGAHAEAEAEFREIRQTIKTAFERYQRAEQALFEKLKP